MRKKGVIFFCVMLLVVILLFNFKSYFGFNDNSLNVNVGSKLDISKVKIYKGFFPFDSLDMEKMNGLNKLIFKGHQTQKIETDYGENDFIFVYSDKLYCKFRHNKTNNRQGDTYTFVLNKTEDDLNLVVNIEGTDPQKIQKKLMVLK
jgi:hypothetical protein